MFVYSPSSVGSVKLIIFMRLSGFTVDTSQLSESQGERECEGGAGGVEADRPLDNFSIFSY